MSPAAAGPRVVVERLDDRASGRGGLVAAAADNGLLCRLVDSLSGLHNSIDDEISFGLEHSVVDDTRNDADVVDDDESAAEEAGLRRLVGGGAAQSATGGAAAGVAYTEGVKLQLNLHQQKTTSSMDIDSTSPTGGPGLDLDTPTTETLFEALWPEVGDLGDQIAPNNWPGDDFDLLFPDLA